MRGTILRLHDLEAFESLNASLHRYSARPWAASKLPRHSSISQTTALCFHPSQAINT